MKNLFNYGFYQLHSGQFSNYKIDCDALTDKDIEALARMIDEKFMFFDVIGIPQGGLRLAQALGKYTRTSGPLLIVDDVLTTGKSMEEMKKRHGGLDTIGIVIFARNPCPYWVKSIFQMWDNSLWTNG